MTQGEVLAVFQEALLVAMKISAPLLIASIAIGLVVAIFQAATQIHEQTLTFVPKIICVFLSLILFGNWMMTAMVEFMVTLWSNFGLYTGS